MAKTKTPAGNDATAGLDETSADNTVDAAMAAMQAQIDMLAAQNADLTSRLHDGRKAPEPHEIEKLNEKFKAIDLEDPANMSMMERRGAIPTHATSGEPIFNPLRSAVRPPA